MCEDENVCKGLRLLPVMFCQETDRKTILKVNPHTCIKNKESFDHILCILPLFKECPKYPFFSKHNALWKHLQYKLAWKCNQTFFIQKHKNKCLQQTFPACTHRRSQDSNKEHQACNNLKCMCWCEHGRHGHACENYNITRRTVIGGYGCNVDIWELLGYERQSRHAHDITV